MGPRTSPGLCVTAIHFHTYVHVGSNSVQDSRGSSHSSSRCVDSTGTSISRSEGAAARSPKPPVKPIASLDGSIKGDLLHDIILIYIQRQSVYWCKFDSERAVVTGDQIYGYLALRYYSKLCHCVSYSSVHKCCWIFSINHRTNVFPAIFFFFI